MLLKNINEELPINVSTSEMWRVLSQYGDVSKFHAGVKESITVEGSTSTVEMGGERICNIVDMGLKIQLKERITHLDEGKSYRYEVYEWKNFPLSQMFFKFSIRESEEGFSLLRLDIDYLAKPKALTPLMAWKMRALTHDILLGYKHHTETGEFNIPIKQLRNRYRLVSPNYQQQVITS